MKKSRKKKRIYSHRIFSILLLCIGIGGSFFAFKWGYDYTMSIIQESTTRQRDPNIREMSLQVNRDTTLKDISNVLQEKNFITHKRWFLLQGKLSQAERHLKPGAYSISSNMSDTDLLNLLTKEQQKEDTIKFTIPEGFTVIQIAERLDKEGIVSKKDFLKAVNDRTYNYAFLKDAPQDSKYKLEGYLFPDTYIIRKNATPEEIIMKMLNQFEHVMNQYSTYLHNTTYSLHDIVTIASIIQQEAKLSDEQPIISGVIYNRLNADVKLQMCSTIQYILEKRKANLSYDDLEVESPYNTYKYKGIPVGPICSPGEQALSAALLPEKNDYFYFVLKDNESGTHTFSKTAKEHEQNKIKYQQTIDKNFQE